MNVQGGRPTSAKVGVVSFWFNRGQATVGWALRDALESLGHQVSVLARPDPAGRVESDPRDRSKWVVPNLVQASSFNVPSQEYVDFAAEYRLDVCFFFQNYDFDSVALLQRTGVRTIGTFMREDFGAEHADAARRAYSLIYAMTPSDVARFASLGIKSSYLPWASHPADLRAHSPRRSSDLIHFLFPGGYLSARKPAMTVIDAFRKVKDPRARLTIKAQDVPIRGTSRLGPVLRQRVRTGLSEWRTRRPQMRSGVVSPISTVTADRLREFIDKVREDPRVHLEVGDLPTTDYAQLLVDSSVLVAPARWEGLGVHLYEARHLGLPVVANDMAPISDVVVHGKTGLLAVSRPVGLRPSGVAVHETDVDSLAACLEEMCDDDRRDALGRGSLLMAQENPWSVTVDAVGSLVELALRLQ